MGNWILENLFIGNRWNSSSNNNYILFLNFRLQLSESSVVRAEGVSVER